MPVHTKTVLLAFAFLFSVNAFAQTNTIKARVKVSADGHSLQYEDGTGFFWLGDTAWELFHRLTREEIEKYLENRRQKGFTVIQAVVLAEMDGLRRPNQYGDIPLTDLDPAKPNEKYFQLVDWVIKTAGEKGLFIGLLPTWGDKVNKIWGTGPEIFNETNAYAYGQFIGSRYKAYSNVIWIAGGDRPAFNDSMDWRPVWQAMIKGIRAGAGKKALVTYHPWGGFSSTQFFSNNNPLDFNMLQSGHAAKDIANWEWIKRDREILPAKPILDGEPNYEDHPINWDQKNGYFRDYDVRKQMYRSVFAGACGVTYGNQAIWQFYSPREEKIAFPDRYWTEAIDRPGGFQAGYLRKLIESRPYLDRQPDQSIIIKGQGEKGEYITAFRDGDNSYAMIYLPVGKTIEVNTSWMKGDKMVAWWFNPKDGKARKIGESKRKNSLSLTTPSTGAGNDWVLVLDDAAKKWDEPGR